MYIYDSLLLLPAAAILFKFSIYEDPYIVVYEDTYIVVQGHIYSSMRTHI